MSNFSELAPDLFKELRRCQKFSKCITRNSILTHLVKILQLPLVGDFTLDLQCVKNTGDRLLMEWFIKNLSGMYVRGISNNSYRTHLNYIIRHYNGEPSFELVRLYQKYKLMKIKSARTEKGKCTRTSKREKS